MHAWQWVACWYLAASVAAFGAFAWDKLAARTGRRRLRERTLHILELVGGWPGALAAIFWLRHKSSKAPFLLVTFLIMAAHVIAAMVWMLT